MNSTDRRVPRITGLPARTSGSTTMRSESGITTVYRADTQFRGACAAVDEGHLRNLANKLRRGDLRRRFYACNPARLKHLEEARANEEIARKIHDLNRGETHAGSARRAHWHPGIRSPAQSLQNSVRIIHTPSPSPPAHLLQRCPEAGLGRQRGVRREVRTRGPPGQHADAFRRAEQI